MAVSVLSIDGAIGSQGLVHNPWLSRLRASSRLKGVKSGIHPEYTLANVHCSCGNQFYTRSTQADLHVELCSECHPFYTGRQKIVDTAGRVEKFKQRYTRSAKAGGTKAGAKTPAAT